ARTGREGLGGRRARGPTSRRKAIAAIRSASAPISTALATRSSGSSTGSNNVVGWRRATTGSLPTTLPSFNSRQSGYGCALMSPRPSQNGSFTMNVAWGRFRPAHRAGRFDRLFESHRQRRTPLPSGDVDVLAAHNRGRCRAGACPKGEEEDDLTHSLIGIGRPLLPYRPCDSVKAARFVIIVTFQSGIGSDAGMRRWGLPLRQYLSTVLRVICPS